MTQFCCHPDCCRAISKGRVLCGVHWRLLDEKTKAKIHNYFEYRLIGFKNMEAARQTALDFFKK